MKKFGKFKKCSKKSEKCCDKCGNFLNFLQIRQIFRNFLFLKKIIVFSLNDCKTVNLQFLCLIFEFTPFLFRPTEKLMAAQGTFMTKNFPQKIQKFGVNRKTGGKVRCLHFCHHCCTTFPVNS
jgi:hypothetical protein